ncbi:MAG: AAA family ATPase, partial [bacterium]
GEGPVEAIWESRVSIAGSASATLPAGTRDLWEVVSGPDAVIATLRTLMPPTVVLTGERRLEDPALDEWRSAWRMVSLAGELGESGVHVARRWEVGAEALLKARNELVSVAGERAALIIRRDAARKRSAEAVAAMEQAEARFRAGEEGLREAERQVAAQKNESELFARRIEEADAQCTELREREERESGLIGQMTGDLQSVEQAMAAGEAELDGSRASLRAVQARLETMRRTVATLEEKKGQAALLEVRLRERCRSHVSERERARTRHEAGLVDAARCERRVAFLAGYLPVLSDLLSAVEQLAERSHAVAADLASRVEEARMRSEGTAKVIRDWGGSEAEFQLEYDGMAAELAQSRVDLARLGDRRSLLEGELAELRRRHLSPRGVTTTDVVGEDAGALAAAVERAERRRERIGPVNPLAERECAELEERSRFLGEQRGDLESSLTQLEEVIGGLDEHIERVFAEVFDSIRENFSSVIATVFPGAKGALRLTEGAPVPPRSEGPGEVPLAEVEEGVEATGDTQGIVLEVRFPNKAPRSMGLLSGGEKAMTAIAFLFSLFLARPCPFYILDEVEASLDDVNIRRFLELIRGYRGRTQFIIITHQRQTMEVADTLYGVALESDGTSRVLSRRLGGKTQTAQGLPGQSEVADVMAKGA